MPKAKPISLFPLNFDEAITALIHADPGRLVPERKQRGPSRKSKRPTKKS